MFTKFQIALITILSLVALVVAPVVGASVAFDDDAPDAEATPEVTAEPDDDDDLPITIIIEGPVEAINVNIITIFSLEIEVDEDDPILLELVIGDNIHIEGNISVEDGAIVIIVVNITIIQIDIIIGDDPTSSRTSGQSNKSSKGSGSKKKSS